MGYTVPVSSLLDVTKEEQEEINTFLFQEEQDDSKNIPIFKYFKKALKETKESIGDFLFGIETLPDKIKPYNIKEREELRHLLEESKIRFMKVTYQDSTTVEEAEKYAEKLFGIKVDYRNAKTVEVPNAINKAMLDFFKEYGDLDAIKKNSNLKISWRKFGTIQPLAKGVEHTGLPHGTVPKDNPKGT